VFGFARFRAPSEAEVRTAIAFTLAALAADFLTIRYSSQLSFSLSLPVVLASAMVLTPPSAALVGFLSTADVSDLRGRLPLLRALFNRSQIGLSSFAASAVFHSLGGLDLGWPLLLLPSIAAVAVDSLVNTASVAWPVARLQGRHVIGLLRDMFGPNYLESLLRYVAVGFMAPLIATVWLVAGLWGLFAFLLPIALAWLASAKSRELDIATQRLEKKDDALAESLNQMDSERRQERLALAGDLHDEVLPALFRVHLLGKVIEKDLESGRLLQLEDDVVDLAQSVSNAQLSVRHVVNNLRGSAIGADGLVGAIEQCARSLEAVSEVRFSLELAECAGTSASQLMVFQVAREAMRNAVQHSRSDAVMVRLWQDDGCIRVSVRDEGVGFDQEEARGSLHFGLHLMAERAEAVGGRLVVDSALGSGTSVTLTMPPDA
jgi:signal transduction histidine kinase